MGYYEGVLTRQAIESGGMKVAEESLRQTVIRLSNDFEKYKDKNDTNIKEFKKETRTKFDDLHKENTKKFEKVDEKIDNHDSEIKVLKTQLNNMEKMLTRIDGTSIFIRNSLIGGVITLIVSLVIKFSN